MKLFAIILLAVAVLATFGMVAVQTASADCSITTTLRVGSKGEEVKCLQMAVGVTADGSFGPKTRAAVVAWQKSLGLSADGVFGPKSRAVWIAAGGTVSASFAPAGCTSASGYSPTLGLAGGLCYAVGATPPVPATGCQPGWLFNPTTGVSCSGSVVVPVSGSVSVALASDNPASGTLLIDDTTGVMQNAAPIVKFVFSNGTGSAVNVNTLKLTRTGIAADGDINNLFLYDGVTKLAELSSVSTKVFSFNSSAGLFTIPANSSKAIWVGVNMAVATSGPNTVGFSINASSDVVLGNATSAGGSFPINGNQFATAFITDLGYINLTNTTTFPATIDPKPEAQELWRFTATANSQKMNLKRIVMTVVGTTSPGDIQDLALSVGGVQVGAVAQIGIDNKVVFDWSATPYTLLSGQNKVFVLSGKVVKGTGRAVKFTIRSTADFVSTDTNYNADTAPLLAGAALTVVDPDSSGDGTNINNGSLTISRSANSPAGNIASDALDVPLARFDYRANGEDIKVSYVRVSVNNSENTTLDDGKLYFNGSQVGTTDDSVADATDNVFSLGNTVIIPAGTTGVFEYRANIQVAATGTGLAADGTVVVSLSAGTSGDAIGQISLTSLTPSASTGQTLTVKTGTLTQSTNSSFPSATTVNTSGVVGATNVKVASLILTAGSGESVNVTQVVLGDDPGDATSDFGDNFQNLTIRNGALSSTSTPLATVQGTLSGTAGADFTFSLSPSITIAAGTQYVIDVYADILTGAAGFATAQPGLEFVNVSATGISTSADAYPTATVADLQSVVIASSGSLTITANAATPVAGQLVMGETGQTVAILDFAAGSAEDVDVSVIILTDTSSFAGSLSNIKLYAQGITAPIGELSSFSAQSNGTATFNLASDWSIPKNLTKTLTVKADVNAYGSAVSGGSHTVNLASAANVTTRGHASGVAIAETVTTATGTAQTVYRTRVIADLASTSPSGSSTVGAGKSVFEFTVTANPAYAAVVNAVALTMSGSANMTSSGNAVLYKSTDLNTALATEAYVTDTATSGTTTTFLNSAGCDSGIPVGANVRLYDASASAYGTTSGGYEIVSVDSTGTCTWTFTPAAFDVDTSDIMYYRPMQPGTGKLYFGAQTTLTADVANSATSLTVTSTDGFAVGDTVALTGHTTAGVATSVASGCVITYIASATALTTTACVLTPTTGIDYDYLSGTAANAIANYHNSAAFATTGLISQEVAAGSSMTFVVKGDTTSTGTAADNLGAAKTSATLQASLASVADLNWDDKLINGIITVTKNLPINGNTLTYAY